MSHNLFNGPKDLLNVIQDITEKKKATNEHDMPNDEVLYKAAKDSGRKNPGESGDSGVSERCWNGYEPTPGKKAYDKGSCQKESSPLQVPTGDGNYYKKERVIKKMAGDEELGESPEELTLKKVSGMEKDLKSEKVAESPEFGDEIHQEKLKKHNSSDPQLPGELAKYNAEELGKKKDVKENYASQEPSSAVGQRREEELPKNVDVVIDSSMYGTGYRVLISYPNIRPLLFPEAGKESALSKQELVAAIPVEHLAYCIDKIEFAFKNSKEHNSNFQSSDAGVANHTPNVVKGQKS